MTGHQGESHLETGYQFKGHERVHIYLTNALEPPLDLDGQFDFALPALAREAIAVNEIKRLNNFTVIVGNPPYSKLSANLEEQHRRLVDAYRYINGERIVERGALALEMNLQDDYVKFVARSESWIQASGLGVIGMITNHGYLTTPTLRGMRWHLWSAMSSIAVLDLHGHSGKGERNPAGGPDENVFDIQQGVAISLLVLGPRLGPAIVKHGDLYGTRQDKYAALAATTSADIEANEVVPSTPNYLFDDLGQLALTEYRSWTSIPNMMILTSDGIVTARDSLVVGFTEDELIERMTAFRDAPGSPEEVCQRFGINPSSAGFNPGSAIADLRSMEDLRDSVIRIQYRPFDYRYLFYRHGFVQSMRRPVTSQLSIPGNLVIGVTRQVNRPQYEHAFVSRVMFEKKAVSHDRNTQVFPVLVQSAPGGGLVDVGIESNYSLSFIQKWVEAMGEVPSGSDAAAFSPVFYTYAILYSPTYRDRYFGYLRSEYPSIPMANDPELTVQLVDLGRQISSLHLLEAEVKPVANVLQPRKQVSHIAYDAGTVRVAPDTVLAEHVPESAWEFRIGGYPVLHKWLKDRKGRVLTSAETSHYGQIVSALSGSVVLMNQIDEVINAFGGWPGAFTSDTEAAATTPK